MLKKMIILTITLIFFLFSGCTDDFAKDIKSDNCPVGYKRADGFCEGTEDNVFYFETPKSKVIFHFPKVNKVDASSKVKKGLHYKNTSIIVAMLNYKTEGYETYDGFFNKHYYPNFLLLLDNQSKDEYNKELSNKGLNMKLLDVKEIGQSQFFGYDGWQAETKGIYNDDKPVVIFNKMFIFPLDDPYGITIGITLGEETYNEEYTDLRPYLEKLEIEIEE